MVIFKGTQRIFDKVVKENNTSTIQNRIISLYGVTSYEDITDVLIQIISSFKGTVSTNIQVNNLGALPLKMLDKNGIEIMVEDGWVIPNQVYTIMYRNGSFILLSNNSNDSNNIYEIPEEVLELTSSSTSSDIETVFDGNESEFIESILNKKSIIISGEDTRININYILDINNNVLEEFTLEFIHQGYYYKQVFTVDSNMNIVSVNVIKSSVESPSVIVEDTLTSDSHVNPPSVHAVNDAIGQIDTLLNQILGN